MDSLARDCVYDDEIYPELDFTTGEIKPASELTCKRQCAVLTPEMDGVEDVHHGAGWNLLPSFLLRPLSLPFTLSRC